MQSLKKRIPFFLLLFLANQAWSQSPERLQVHFDKPFYVAGEDIWFSIYFQNASEEMQSNIVRLEWLSPDGRVVERQKLAIDGQVASGDLAIPYDWSEGNYAFRAHTVWNLNFSNTPFYERIIPIYNLLETPQIAERPEENANEPQTLETWNNLRIEGATTAQQYRRRETVKVTIQLKNGAGNLTKGQFSVAVTDNNYLPNTFFSNGNGFSERIGDFQNKYAAEADLLVNGQLKNPSGELVDTRFLSIYLPTQKKFVKTIVSKGQLNAALPKYQGTQPLQLFDMNPFHEPIPTFEIEEVKVRQPYESAPLLRSEVAANYLFLLSKYRQYRETFNLPTPNYNLAQPNEKPIWTYDRAWDMEQYTALSDLASFVAEVIPGGRVVNQKGKRTIRLQYAEKSLYNRLSPWYLVNGWLTEDEDVVLKIPFRAVETVEMFNSKKTIANQLDPSMVSRGLLSITTKDRKTPDAITNKPNNVQWSGLYPIRQFPKLPLTNDKIPDFRPLVYWNPTIETDENGRATFEFITSDGIGIHQIKIMGINENGQLGEQVISYEVIR
ncbi:MAG: hypothetical protein AAF960_23860 [Bacteroidota bacterium]